MAKAKGVEEALATYIARRDRQDHPDGKFDNAGRWYPSATERRECCDEVRGPSRAYPYSFLKHCRSLRHCAKLYGVGEGELRAALRQAEPAWREGGDSYYKIVAIHPDTGKLVSVFDGETEYQIGVTLNGKARQGHEGGYYCYKTKEAAIRAAFPKGSVGKLWAKKVLRIQAEGQYVTYPQFDDWGRQVDRKLAFSHITPVEVLDDLSYAGEVPPQVNTCFNCMFYAGGSQGCSNCCNRYMVEALGDLSYADEVPVSCDPFAENSCPYWSKPKS